MSIELTDKNSHYLGDGAYACTDSIGRIWVVTYNGINITNQVCLEGDAIKSLVWYVNSKRAVVECSVAQIECIGGDNEDT